MVYPTVNSTNQFNSSFQNLTTNNISTAFQTTSPFVMTRVWWCHCIPQHLHVYSWWIESKIESTTGLFSLFDLKICSYISVHSSFIYLISNSEYYRFFITRHQKQIERGDMEKPTKRFLPVSNFLHKKGQNHPLLPCFNSLQILNITFIVLNTATVRTHLIFKESKAELLLNKNIFLRLFCTHG